MSTDKREELAAYAHEAWSGMMRWLFSKGEFKNITRDGEPTTIWIMPSWAVERWQRQMNTPYADLPEPEKVSDRAEADQILAILNPEAP